MYSRTGGGVWRPDGGVRTTPPGLLWANVSLIAVFGKGVAASWMLPDNKPAGVILCFMQFKY